MLLQFPWVVLGSVFFNVPGPRMFPGSWISREFEGKQFENWYDFELAGAQSSRNSKGETSKPSEARPDAINSRNGIFVSRTNASAAAIESEVPALLLSTERSNSLYSFRRTFESRTLSSPLSRILELTEKGHLTPPRMFTLYDIRPGGVHPWTRDFFHAFVTQIFREEFTEMRIFKDIEGIFEDIICRKILKNI